MRTISRMRTLAGLTLLALVAAGCGGGDDGDDARAGDRTGVTADTVTIGGHFPLTGPAAPGYSAIPAAHKAYYDYVNTNGGVNGRRIEWKFRDDAYNPTQTVQVTRQLVLQDKIFAMVGGLGTPTHSKVTDFLNQQKVPDLFVSSGAVQWDSPDKHPYTFGWQPDYYVEGKVLGRYLADTFPGKRVAVFHQNDDFGADGRRGLAVFWKEPLVAEVAYEPGNVDIAPQVAQLAQARPDVIVSFSIPTYTALLKLGLLRANLSPQLVVSNVGSDPVTLIGLLESFAERGGSQVRGAQLIEGLVTDSYLPPYLGPEADRNGWTTLFRRIWADSGATTPYTGSVHFGFAQAYTFVQALQRAGTDPTRESLVEAVESGELSGGPGLVPFRFSADSHAGYTGVQVVQVRGGVPVAVGPPRTTDTGTGSVDDFGNAPAGPPGNGIPTSVG